MMMACQAGGRPPTFADAASNVMSIDHNAEGEGFEPPVGVTRRPLSRRLHSAAMRALLDGAAVFSASNLLASDLLPSHLPTRQYQPDRHGPGRTQPDEAQRFSGFQAGMVFVRRRPA